jgi:hypothetical protein
MDEREGESLLRHDIIHRLRKQGWSRIEAENEADERAARRRNAPAQPSSGEQ